LLMNRGYSPKLKTWSLFSNGWGKPIFTAYAIQITKELLKLYQTCLCNDKYVCEKM
jgi:hypothetical protein